jgi:hypothetical protein
MRSGLALIAAVLTASVLASCGGGSSGTAAVSFPTVVTLGDCDICPQINNTSLDVGDNRISITLTDKDDNLVLDAQVHLRFYDLNGETPVLQSEADARFLPVTLAYVDPQSGNRETTSGDSGVYVAHATFSREGDWGAQVMVTRGRKTLKPLSYRFTVLDHSTEPAVGDPAPASEQQTLATAASIDDIDTSYPPRNAMHNITVAEALRIGKPLVIAFATPAFCQTRTCAPVMDLVMDPLHARYGDKAIFIHIEPYELGPLRQSNVQQPVRATQEWRLRSEPWVFVVGRDGRIAGKFEGIMAVDEVEQVLQQAIAAPAPTPRATPP